MMQVSSSTAGRTRSGSAARAFSSQRRSSDGKLLVLADLARQRHREVERGPDVERGRQAGTGAEVADHRPASRGGEGVGERGGAHVCPVDLTGVRRSSNTGAAWCQPPGRSLRANASAMKAAWSRLPWPPTADGTRCSEARRPVGPRNADRPLEAFATGDGRSRARVRASAPTRPTIGVDPPPPRGPAAHARSRRRVHR